jgi:regulator of protease activity HflC (stomatin/prohibitin superfamily)
MLSNPTPLDDEAKWLIAGLVVVALLIIRSVRIPPVGCWLVVTRFGRVIRAGDSGLLLRWPIVERFHCVPHSSLHLPITVSGRTRDAVQVHLLVTAVVRVVDPAVAAVTPDPVAGAAAAVHTALTQLISRSRPTDLLALRANLRSAIADELDRSAGAQRVAVDDLVVDGIETELTLDLLAHTKHRNHT